MANQDIKIKISATDLASQEIAKVGQSANRLRDVFGQVGRDANSMGGSFLGMSKGLTLLGGAVAGLGIGQLMRDFVGLADSAILMEGKLKLVTKSSQELAAVNASLFALAQDTRGSYEETVNLYARLARSSDQLGLSQQSLLTITELINKAVLISGASASEAAGGLIQFSQGLASGRLQGDELRSVLENMPRLAKAIADGMGVTIGQLRELGTAGQLAPKQVLDAIMASGATIRAEFSQLPSTVGQATTQVGNSLLQLAGTFDKMTGLSGKLAGALQELSGILDAIGNRSAGALKVTLNRQRSIVLEEIAAVKQAINSNISPTGFHLFPDTMQKQRELEELSGRLDGLMAQLNYLDGMANKDLGEKRESDRLASRLAELDSVKKAFEKSYQERMAGENKLTKAIESEEERRAKFGPWSFAGLQVEEYEKLKKSLREYRDEHHDFMNAPVGGFPKVTDSWDPYAEDEFMQAMERRAEAAYEANNKIKDSTKSLAEQMDQAFAGWANSMADRFNDLLWSADTTFGDILESFARMLTQMTIQYSIIAPLLESFKSAGGIGGLWSSFTASAKGNVFTSPGLSAYSGQIVSRPTVFPFASGIGLMGEAGPEAILPLKRGSDGALGVTASGGTQEIRVEIVNKGTDKRVASAQPRLDVRGLVVDIFLEDMNSNGPMRQALGGAV